MHCSFGFRLALLAALTAHTGHARAEDPCIAVLHTRIVDEYKLTKSSNLSQDVKEAVCSSTSRWKSKGTNVGVKIPIKKLVVGGNFNQASLEELAEQMCSDNSQSMTSAEAVDVATRLGAGKVNDTYLECRKIAAKQLGLSGNSASTEGGDIVTLTLTWNNPTPGKIEGPAILNPWATIIGPLTCGELAPGRAIHALQTTVSCKRTSQVEPASIVVHTSWADVPFLFEPKVAKSAPPVGPQCGHVLMATDPTDCFAQFIQQVEREADICLRMVAGNTTPASNGPYPNALVAALSRKCQERRTVASDLQTAKSVMDAAYGACQQTGPSSSECRRAREGQSRITEMLNMLH